MEWQNSEMKFGVSFLEEVMKNAGRFPGKYRVRRGAIKARGKKYYLVRVLDGENVAEVLFAENDDGEIEVARVKKESWDVEEALYMAMSGEAERVEILTN